MKLHIDFETRSDVDLKKEGLYKYATGENTDILCMAYGFDEGPISIWKKGEPFPVELAMAIEDEDEIWAHNAQFEMEIWEHVGRKKYGWPMLPIRLVHCNMVQGYSMNLPGSLEKLAPALGLKVEKDAYGSRIMMKLSKPRSINDDGTPVFWEYKDLPEQFERLYSYCKTDVEVERQADARMIAISDKERALWILDQKINSRGLYIDLPTVSAAIEVIEYEKKRLNDLMKEVTSNAVSTFGAVGQLKDWLSIIHDVKIPTTKKKNKKTGEDEDKEGLGKNDVSNLLRKKDLPEVCRKALLIRQEGSKSSTAKLQAMLIRAADDNRVRNTLQFNGAGSTGRWAGRGLQIQNMKRPALSQDEIFGVIELLNSNRPTHQIRNMIDVLYGPPTDVISDCLRAFIVAGPGNKFINADWNSIEARLLAWLAGDESTLQVFRGHGKIYEAEASKIYGVPLDKVTKDQRQIGKVAILALGYGGGVGAFQSMAKNYSISIPDKQADSIKAAWRVAHPAVVNYWKEVEHAAMSAVLNQGQIFAAGPKGRQVKYRVVGSFLWCQLPSKRALCYPYPKVEMVETPWGEEKEAVTYMAEDATSHKWERQKTYGGFFVENITQGLARDVLAEAIPRIENRGYEIAFHVHDEITCEVKEDFGSAAELEKIMCVLPEWAVGLPLAADGWEGKRYRK